MQIELHTLRRMVKSPAADEFYIVRRHYCTQMVLFGLCTTHCLKQCTRNIQRAFDRSTGEFVLNQCGALVMALRDIVYDETSKPRRTRAKTPENDLGDPMPTFDVFTELTKQYEAAAKKRRA